MSRTTTFTTTVTAAAGYILGVVVTPAGSGSVAGTVGGEVFQSGGRYEAGQTVTLTATPSPGYAFDHWGGLTSPTANPVTFTMPSAETWVYAHFREGAPMGTRIEVTNAPPASVRVGESFVFTGYLQDEEGTSLQGKMINLVVGGSVAKSTFTNAGGSWSFTVILPSEGTFSMYAEFPGDDTHAGCE